LKINQTNIYSNLYKYQHFFKYLLSVILYKTALLKHKTTLLALMQQLKYLIYIIEF